MTRKPGSLPGNPTQTHSSSERVPGEGFSAFRFRTEELGGFLFFRLPTPLKLLPTASRRENGRRSSHVALKFESQISEVGSRQLAVGSRQTRSQKPEARSKKSEVRRKTTDGQSQLTNSARFQSKIQNLKSKICNSEFRIPNPKTCLVALLALLLTVTAARAATIEGTVLDPNGRVVPAARVNLLAPMRPFAETALKLSPAAITNFSPPRPA